MKKMKSNVSKKKEAKKGGRNKSLIEQPLLLNEIDKKLEEAQKEKKRKSKQAKKMKKKHNFSLQALTKEIHGYGFEYRMSDFLKVAVLCLAGLIIAGVIYKLNFFPNILILIAVAIALLPGIISEQFKFVYEQQRFADATDYMEQMIYAFIKKPKIIQALTYTKEMCDGRMAECVSKAITYIQRGVFKRNLYQEAFDIIEAEYGCERMNALHKFLAKVETQGGGYKESITVLLNDIQSWTERVYTFQANRKNIKTKIVLVIIMSLIICGAMTYSVPSNFAITTDPVYQWSTTIAVICFMVVYAQVQSKLNSSWLGNVEEDYIGFFSAYKKVLTKTEADLRRKSLPLAIVGGVAGVYGYFGLHSIPIAVVGAAMVIVILTQPKRSMRVARKKVTRAISKEFPGWLRDLSLQLQKENVQNAIVNSIPEAPVVLVPGLKQLQHDLDEDPVTIKPYANFLKEFDLPDVQSAMKMLYSLNAIGKDEVVNQMNGLIIRNQAMLDAAERLKDEDATALSGMLVAVPMAIVTIKMMVDMVLLILSFFNMMVI